MTIEELATEFLEKTAKQETEKERAKGWGRVGALGGAARYAMSPGYFRTGSRARNLGLHGLSASVATSLGYGAGRLAHRARYGKVKNESKTKKSSIQEMNMNANDIEALAQEFLSEMEKEAGIREMGSKLVGHAKRYGQLMKGGKKMTFATGSKTRAVDKVHTARPGNTAAGFKPGQHGNAEARKEALKSLAARAGTAAVAGGAGYAAKKKMDK